MVIGGNMKKITEYITITELAPLLSVTRPTLYKYVLDYEAGDYRNIKYDIVVIFDYITKNANNKVDIINFIRAQNEDDESKLIKDLKNKIATNPEFKKLIEWLVKEETNYDLALNTIKKGANEE